MTSLTTSTMKTTARRHSSWHPLLLLLLLLVYTCRQATCHRAVDITLADEIPQGTGIEIRNFVRCSDMPMAKCCQQINLFGLSVGTFNHLIAEGLEEGDIVAAYGRPGGESHGCAGRVLAAGTRHDENGMWHKYPPRQHQRYTGGRWVNVCRDTQLTMLGVFGNDANAIRVGARKEIDSIEDPKLKSAYEKSFRAGICASVRGSVESAYAAKTSARLRRRGLSAALLSWLEPESEPESESESKLESEQGQESDQAVFPDLISFNGTRYSDDKRGDLVYRDGFGNQLDLTLLMMDSQ